MGRTDGHCSWSESPAEVDSGFTAGMYASKEPKCVLQVLTDVFGLS